MRRDDVIYFAEQCFSCTIGRPYRTVDLDGLTPYVQLITSGDERHAMACLINALQAIHDRLGKAQLVWRMTSKVDYSDLLLTGRTRIWIKGCDDYGWWRKDDWLPPYPHLTWSRPSSALPVLSWIRDPNLVVPVGDDPPPTTPGAA